MERAPDHTFWAIAGGLVSYLVVAHGLQAQVMMRLPEEPQCRNCRILVEDVVELDPATSGVPLSRHTRLYRGAPGSIIAVDPIGALAVEFRDGRPSRSIDFSNLGMDFISAVATGAGGELHLFGSGLHVRVDPSSEASVSRLTEHADVRAAAVLNGDTLVIQADRPSPEHAGIPFHLFYDGKISGPRTCPLKSRESTCFFGS